MSNDYPGFLFALEGIDGAGTTTVSEGLERRHDTSNFIFTQEPSHGEYGRFVRENLTGENNVSPADFYSFLADRYDHCENLIEPALKEDKTVVTDRYALSTYAYQSKVLDEDLDVIDPFSYIEDMTYHFTIEPDAYFYIDLPVEKAIERKDDISDKYETRERMTEAKRIYDYFAEEKENVIRVPGQWSESEIIEEVDMYINGMMND